MTGPETIVIALGGNALSPPGRRSTIQEQFAHTRESLGVVVELARRGARIVIVHGNGPQVGEALTRNEMAADDVEPLPLGVLVAGTAGWIGYMIQQSLQNAFRLSGVDREVLTVITQTVVREDDPGLRVASKPIGRVLSADRAERLRVRGEPIEKDLRGRWRRMAPSPCPAGVVETAAVRRLVDEGVIVVAAGGGGPPVYETSRGWEGVDAVVDKDRTAAVLGTAIDAETLLILTNVDGVYREWGTPRAERIPSLALEEAEALLADEHVGSGSMRPKLEAAVSFVRGGGRRAVIADLGQGISALAGDGGTTIGASVQ